jgi:hypothetical protein
MKLEWFRANPNWVGTFNTNLMGLAAFGERFVRMQYPLFGINSVFEALDFKFILGEGRYSAGCNRASSVNASDCVSVGCLTRGYGTCFRQQ